MISYSKILEFHHTLRKSWQIDIQGRIGHIKIRPHFDRPNLTLNVNSPSFPQGMIKFKDFWLRHRSKIKNQSGGKKDLPFLILPFFWCFGVKNGPKKRPDPIFLELCECFLLSYMICQKVEKFSLQNMQFLCFGGSDP